VAESYEANDDATVWTFKIRKGLKFSNGEKVLPSSFARAWERASDPDFAGVYSYLMTFIKGGAEKLDGKAKTLEGVDADDEAMTLTVTLAAPYSNFDAVSGFQLFFPMPKAVEQLDDQTQWDNGMMIGNGPFMLDKPRSDTEIVLVRNPKWNGTKYDKGFGLPKQPYLDKITFKVQADPDTSYNAFSAGEGNDGQVPSARVGEVRDAYPDSTTLGIQILGSYHYDISLKDPVVGGEKNVKLRQAMSMAINRDRLNERVWDKSRTVSTGITPPGIPGFKKDLCDFCAYDKAAAQKAYDEWKDEGNEIKDPIKIQFNIDAGHEDVVDLIIDDWKAIGIPAERQGIDTETYFTQLSEGACVVCRAGWFADYPTYDNFMFDLWGSESSNNYSYMADKKFDKLVADAKSTVDKDDQAKLFQDAEQVLLNDDVAVIPLVWYRGDYVYDPETVDNFPATNFGLIIWEQVALK
jgi:ABC-type oligopeptide transport system substrate-binding subunit